MRSSRMDSLAFRNVYWTGAIVETRDGSQYVAKGSTFGFFIVPLSGV